MALPAHGEEGKPSIVASDLFSQRDLDAFGPALARYSLGQRWLPYAPDYVAAHASEPEHPNMRPEFTVWVKSLLAPQWLPADLPDSAIYLRVGKHRESRYRSCFYATYEIDGTTFMVKGYLDSVQVTIKPPGASLTPSVAAAFGEAIALGEAREAGKAVLVSRGYDTPSQELQSYLRGLAETYVNSVSLPQTEAIWTRELAAFSAVNDGFHFGWLTDGYVAYAPARGNERAETVCCSLWTNGRAIRLNMDHSGIWVHSFQEYLDTFPQPVPAPVEPLNPEAVELWDMRKWTAAEGGPASDEARAADTVVTVVVKEPYGPRLGDSYGPAIAEGQWCVGMQVPLPLDALRWHLVEVWALAGAAGSNLWQGGYYQPESFAEELGRAADRAACLEEAREQRDACAALAARFAALRYPIEAEAEWNGLVSALQANLQAWDAALAYWELVVQSYPDASEAFYWLQGGNLEGQLEKEGLTKVAERVGKAVKAFGKPLFERYGLRD